MLQQEGVTSLAEVWIEIDHMHRAYGVRRVSLPSRKCGLKSYDKETGLPLPFVTSLAEVWIEIYLS